ncbi:hypothetical protein ACLMJK_001735 [Lecanora helva]
MANPKSPHNQPTPDPIAHFKTIPWCNALLTSPRTLAVAVPDRTPTTTSESNLVRVTLNTPSTVRACVTFFRMPTKAEREGNTVGETRERPFVEIGCLLDVGDGLAGRAHVMHGGVFSVVLDEVLSTVAYQHSDHGAITAYLNVQWKRPLVTPSVTLCKGRVVKKEGKKVFVKGSFHDAEGNTLAEAEGLWILLTGKEGKPKL